MGKKLKEVNECIEYVQRQVSITYLFDTFNINKIEYDKNPLDCIYLENLSKLNKRFENELSPLYLSHWKLISFEKENFSMC